MSRYKEDIVELRKEGKSYREIENELGCSRGTVAYHCKKEGLQDIGMKKEISNDDKEKIKKLYNEEDESAEFVANKLNISKGTVIRHGNFKRENKPLERKRRDRDDYLNSRAFQGDITEEKVAVKFLEMGYSVLDPRKKEKYDLVVQLKSDSFSKVQCKSSVYNENYLTFKTYWTGRKEKYFYSSKDIDYFATWCRENDSVYIIPFNEAKNQTSFRLRLKPTENNQQKRVNWAEEYLLENMFD